MRFGNYKISMIFALFAATFIIMAITYEDKSFLGGTLICLIFGIKKIKNDKPK